jgi:hypothetical protein
MSLRRVSGPFIAHVSQDVSGTWAQVASTPRAAPTVLTPPQSFRKVSPLPGDSIKITKALPQERRIVVNSYKKADATFLEMLHDLVGEKYTPGVNDHVNHRKSLARAAISLARPIPREMIESLEKGIKGRKQARGFYGDADHGHEHIIQCHEEILAILTRRIQSSKPRERYHATRSMDSTAGSWNTSTPKPRNLGGPWRRMD